MDDDRAEPKPEEFEGFVFLGIVAIDEVADVEDHDVDAEGSEEGSTKRTVEIEENKKRRRMYKKLNRMKELAREWAADLKVAFQPNRFPPAPFSDIFSHSDLLSSGSA